MSEETEDETEEGYSWIIQTPTEVYETGLKMEFGIDFQMLINAGGVYNMKMCQSNVSASGMPGGRPSVATIAIGGPLYGEDEVFLGFKGDFHEFKTHIRQLYVGARGILANNTSIQDNSSNVSLDTTLNSRHSAVVDNRADSGNVQIQNRMTF